MGLEIPVSTSLMRAAFLLTVALLAGSARTIEAWVGSKPVGTPPGAQQEQCFRSFAGYLPVSGNKFLFHWYHEATSAPSSKPVVLWLNGGPGCSSLGGMFTELGPYVLDENLNITYNPFAWNKAANILFMEQPAGVGFSYPGGARNDSLTADDTYEGLVQFFASHPEPANRPFYVAGESYGGHYVPNIVKRVQEGNNEGTNPKINLVGFAVGNGYTDWQLDFNANVENGRFHALTSQAIFDEANKACAGDFARCFWPRDGVTCPDDCNAAVSKATENAMDDSIDIYDIYEDVCLSPEGDLVHSQMSTLKAERGKQRERMLRSKSIFGKGTTISPVFDTCIDNFVATYLNQPAVQKAIGIHPGTISGGKWSDCGGVDYHFNYESELPNYRRWASEGDLQILIYNGDADSILSHMGNSAWINQGLNLTKSAEWAKWRGSDRQVAGYFEQYKTAGIPLTFLTVKGAGHMVPKDRPRHALDMFSQFLSGKPYSSVVPAPTSPLCPAK